MSWISFWNISTCVGAVCGEEHVLWTSLAAQMVKRLPTMWVTWVCPLGWEDPLEKGMAAHSSIFAWKVPWTEEPGRLQSTGLQTVGHDWATSLSLSACITIQALAVVPAAHKSYVTLSIFLNVTGSCFSHL